MSDATSPPMTLPLLTRKQRRVLGTLMEKGFTTPDQYPLTLKATTTGCNQKNNREPASSYDEDTVFDTLEQLREIGLVGVLHTESGRTERYRHYLRQVLKLTEAQLAIMTELLLRGRQQAGELRTRASRMVEIPSQDQLKEELQGLIGLGYVQSNAPLDRRGVEIDHNLYPEGENHEPLSPFVESPSAIERPAAPAPRAARETPEVESLKEEVSRLKERLEVLEDKFEELRRQLT